MFDGPKRSRERLAQRQASGRRDEAGISAGARSALNARPRSPDCAKEERSGQSVEQRLKGLRLKAGRPEMRLQESSRTGHCGLDSTEVLPHFTDQEAEAQE